MKICIYDKDEAVCTALQNSISDCFLSSDGFYVKCIYSCNEMLDNIENGYCADAYFINADQQGFITAEIIRRTFPETIIVLTSDSDERIYESFSLDILYYLKKPFSKEEFSCLFKRMIAKHKSKYPFITLRWKNERHMIPINDIIYIEGYNRHLTFYTKDGEYSSVGKIQNIYERLCAYGFVRIHQGYCVNMKHIMHFSTNEVIMDDGTKVMISTRRKSEALKIYDIFLSQSNM